MSERFGRYVVGERLGSGAMGQVFRARDEMLGRDVAIKVERAIPGLAGAQLKTFQERFLREARALAALSHPNVVRVFDMGLEDGSPYVVMEVVGGKSLRARLDTAPLDPMQVRALGVQVARALAAAHEAGLLHRDVKPANILEAEPGVWKLADFGVARMPESDLTLVGQFLGSPAYAAPESLGRGEFSVRSDVFSLAATLYEALVGRTPFGGRSQLDMAIASETEAPPLPATTPPEMARAILAALASDPARRPTAAQLADDLAGGPSPAPSPPPTHEATPAAAPSLPLVRQALVVTAVFLAGIVIGRCSASDRPAPARVGGGPAAADRPEPAAATDEPTFQRRGKHADRWRKANEKLDEGDVGGGARELMKILDEHPEDTEARERLDELVRTGAVRFVQPED